MKNQQAYFVRIPNHRIPSQKESFTDDAKSVSQNRIKGRPSPGAQSNSQRIVAVRPRVDLPQLPSPRNRSNQSISKFKSHHNLTNMQAPTPRRFKSDEQEISQLQLKRDTTFRPRMSQIKPRMLSNHTPLIKIKTEPSEIQQSPVIHIPKRFDDSREMIYQLQRRYDSSKIQKTRISTEPDDPYKLRGSILKKKTQSILASNGVPPGQKYYIDIPVYDDDSQFFNDEKEMKTTQKNGQPIINQATKEKILDLLFLSTGELKQKFQEQPSISQSKLTSRHLPNKLIIPKNGKSKFPTDFFNVLIHNTQQNCY